MLVEYDGKSIETISWVEVSEEERIQLKKEFFTKPDFSQVLKQLQNLSNNGIMVDKITRYYFKDIMAKVYIKGSKWSVEDVFNSKEILGMFKARTQTNTKIFDSPNLITNIETAIRLGGHNIASMPPNFPIKAARNITNKYNINNNWYDFSCGWGVRLLCAMSSKINYFGTDPNYLLTERLAQLTEDYRQNIGLTTKVDIRTQGSEIFIPEWENAIGLAFSSPPYFDLEDYVIGNQSYNPDISYTQWKENYLLPTLKNINMYLVNNGILALNIKNGKTYKLADDTKQLAGDVGFQLIDIELLTNNQRITSSGPINNSENIFIFKKKETKKITIPSIQPIVVEEPVQKGEKKVMEMDMDNIRFNDLTRDFLEEYIAKLPKEDKLKLKEYIAKNPRDNSSKTFMVVKSYIYNTYFKKQPIEDKKKNLFTDALEELLNVDEDNE